MIKGAIFDIDGTLFDSMFIWNSIGEDYLRSIGHEPREDLNKTFKDMSLYQAACYYKSEYGVTLSIEEIMEGVNDMIMHYYRDVVQLKPGVTAFLRRLNDCGVKMCIATATDTPLVEAALMRCGISKFFSQIFTCTSVGHGKDEPVIFRQAVKHLGTEKHCTVVFEDALYAIRTAKHDGFPVVAIRDMYEEGQEEVRALADLYLSDFLDFSSFWKYVSGE